MSGQPDPSRRSTGPRGPNPTRCGVVLSEPRADGPLPLPVADPMPETVEWWETLWRSRVTSAWDLEADHSLIVRLARCQDALTRGWDKAVAMELGRVERALLLAPEVRARLGVEVGEAEQARPATPDELADLRRKRRQAAGL